MTEHSDLAQFIEPVARALLGDPNMKLSTKKELRFGSNGSLKVDLEKGTAYSHEDADGGGVLWLIKREKGLEGAEAFDWLREIGCDVPDRRQSVPAAVRSAPPSDQPAKIVATYDYVDESGDLLFQVVRFDPKDFRQRRPDQTERSGWSYKVQGVRQVPYHLPELMESVSQERTIFIVEGEKDADNLIGIGVPATCNAGGAGKWPEELTEFFRGADVVILSDNDPQARNKKTGELRWYPADHAEFPNQPIFPGQDHAELVARRLSGVANSLKVLALPGLPLKGDATDWIKAGGTAESLYELAEAAPSWTRRPERTVTMFGGMRWEDIGTAGSELCYRWLVEDIVPLGEITLVYGESGSGKSFGIFDMSVKVARGESFAGRNVEPGLVVYVAAEAGKGFSKRKVAYANYHGIAHDAPIPFYLCTKRPDFFRSDDDVEKLIAEINRVCKAYGVKSPVLIVLDTLSALAPGMNENASQDVSMVRHRLVRLQEHFNEAAIILVHHKPKNGSTPRGHSSLTADFETTIEFEKLTVRDSRGLFIHRGGTRKQREGKSGLAWEFTLPVFEVGRNKWGNKETSCVAVPHEGHRASTGGYRASGEQRLFLECLFRALNDHNIPTPSGMDPETRYTQEADIRRLMKSQMITGEEDQAKADNRFRTAFSRAGNALRSAHIIGKRDGIVWYTGAMIHGMTYRIEEAEEDAA